MQTSIDRDYTPETKHTWLSSRIAADRWGWPRDATIISKITEWTGILVRSRERYWKVGNSESPGQKPAQQESHVEFLEEYLCLLVDYYHAHYFPGQELIGSDSLQKKDSGPASSVSPYIHHDPAAPVGDFALEISLRGAREQLHKTVRAVLRADYLQAQCQGPNLVHIRAMEADLLRLARKW